MKEIALDKQHILVKILAAILCQRLKINPRNIYSFNSYIMIIDGLISIRVRQINEYDPADKRNHMMCIIYFPSLIENRYDLLKFLDEYGFENNTQNYKVEGYLVYEKDAFVLINDLIETNPEDVIAEVL